MPTTIIRTRKDRDEYVAWSSVVEAPLYVGTRAEMYQYLITRAYPIHTFEEALERLDRAEKHGTSAKWADGMGWDGYKDLGRYEIYQQQGTVRAEDMGDLFRRAVAGFDISDLIKPLDDNEATP